MPAYFKVSGQIDAPSPSTYPCVVSGHALADTALLNAYAPKPADAGKRLTIRDCTLSRVQHFSCIAYGVIFDDVAVRDIRGGGSASFLWGCAFRHTTLAGWIGGLMWRWQVDVLDNDASLRIFEANQKFYETVDWALDVSEAKFSFIEALMGVPSRLIKRNPDKHFVLTRESASKLADSEIGGVWRVLADNLLSSPAADVVIVTGGRGKDLEKQVSEARALRERRFLS